VEFCNDDECEKFLKNIDLTEICQLYLCNLSNIESITVDYENDFIENFSAHNFSARNIESITVDYENDFIENFSAHNFSARLPNRRFHCSYLSIEIEKSRKFGKLYDGNLPIKESLRKLGILGRNGLHSVGKKIAMDLLTGNLMLKYEDVPTDARKPLYIQITNHLIKLGFFNLENTCGCKRFTLIFPDKTF
uniref:Serine/threonine protein kinase n=1 Tax=Strongyloides papillosus TaxID=174720 RepID=A0A0N5BRI3_STREA